MRTPPTPPDQTQPGDQLSSSGGQAPTPGSPAPRVAEGSGSRATSSIQAEKSQIASGDPEITRIAQQLEVFEATSQRRSHQCKVLIRLVSLLFGLLEILLVLRFLFRLLGADLNNSLLRILYSLSHLLMAPFAGIFPDQLLGSSGLWNPQGSQGVFEASTLLALFSYALLTWLIVRLVRATWHARPPRSERRRDPRRR